MIAPHLPSSVRAGDAFWNTRIGKVGQTQGAEYDQGGAGHPPAVAQAKSAYEPRPPNGLRYIAQVRQSLLVCESDDELLVFDRRLADVERRLDALRAEIRQGSLARQHLLFPDRFQVSTPRERTLGRHDTLLRSLGFEWSQLGNDAYVVRAIPALIGDARPTLLFAAALDLLDAADGTAEDTLIRMLRELARVSATPNGEPLSEEEARRIVAAIRPAHRDDDPRIVARVHLPPESADGEDA